MATSKFELSPNAAGAVWVLASAACYAVMAACIKSLAHRHYPETQMLLVRAAAGLVLLAPAMVHGGRAAWVSPRPWVMLRRCLCSATGVGLSYVAIANMPLASAQSLAFSRTLFVLALSSLLLRERVGRMRLTAVAIGFLGVVVMTRPASMQLDLPTLAALCSALLVAYTIVTMKDLTRDHSTLAIVLWGNAGTALISLPLALLAWDTPGWADGAIFLLLATAGVFAQTFFTRGIAIGDASLVSLVDYMRLPFVALLGLCLFGEVVDAWTVVGATLIIASTLTITIRESRLKGKAAARAVD